MRTFLATLLILAVAGASGQIWTPATADELLKVLDASAAKYEVFEHYEARAVLSVFARPGDAQPSERGESRVWKIGSKAKAEHLGMVSYQNNKLRVTIDMDDRIMVLAEPEDFFGNIGLEERRAMLGLAEAIERHGTAHGERFRIRFPQGSEYAMVDFSFDRNGWLRRMETVWAQAIPLVPDNPLTDVILPRVVMELEPPRRIAANAVKADPSEAIAFVAGKPQPTADYEGFKVIDNRLRP